MDRRMPNRLSDEPLERIEWRLEHIRVSVATLAWLAVGGLIVALCALALAAVAVAGT